MTDTRDSRIRALRNRLHKLEQVLIPDDVPGSTVLMLHEGEDASAARRDYLQRYGAAPDAVLVLDEFDWAA